MGNKVPLLEIAQTTIAGKNELLSACRQGDLAAVDRFVSEARAHGPEALKKMLESRDQDDRTALLWACREGQDAVVERLLAAGANVHTQMNLGATPFFAACMNGHLAVVERLLAAGANINTPNNHGATPLYMACYNGHLAVVDRLLVAGVNIEARTKKGGSPLYTACYSGQWTVVERLLAAGANIDTPANDGATPLYVACLKGRLEVVTRLLAGGADIDAPMNEGRTPLYIACCWGHREVVERLLAAGANIDTPAVDGATPSLIACQEGQLEVVVSLLAAGANIRTPMNDGVTPLYMACHNGHRAVVERLLAAGVNTEVPNKSGATPLLVACEKGHHEVVETLLLAGANIDTPMNDGASPLFMACQEGHPLVVERLLAGGANIHTPMGDGVTPFYMACQKNHLAVLERLLAAGANIDTPRDNGFTPLHIASRNGHQSVVKLLLAAGAKRNALFGTLRPIDFAKQQSHSTIVTMLSRSLPAATVAEQQQRIQDIRMQLAAARTQHLRVKRRIQMERAAIKTKAQQEAEAKRLLSQKEAELSAAQKQETELQMEHERMKELLAAAELSNFHVDQSQLEVDGECFAKGGNGFIHRGRYHGTAVAIKYLSEGVPEMYKQEVRMWCKLRHPNVLQLLGISLDISRPMIVMELMEGSLFDRLHDPHVVLKWRRRVEMAHGIAAGISYIHALGAVHRDIKSLNVLVKGWDVKLADFGSTRGQDSLQETTSQAGTLAWLAPELFSNASPSQMVDVYAFGVVMFELATREIPWRGYAQASIVASVIAGERPQFNLDILKEAAGSEFVGLMQKCWNQQAEERPTSAEMLTELTIMLQSDLQSISPTSSTPSAPLQPNYDNFSNFSFSDISLPHTPQPPAADISIPRPPCSSTDWSVEEWLTSLSLSNLIPAFLEHDLVKPSLIKELAMQDLKEELGITSLGIRKEIIQAALLL